jgi:hypothetical protein
MRKKCFAMLASMACVLAAAPAVADADKYESGKGPLYRYHDRHDGQSEYREKRADRKEEYWDGNCKVERKWERDGEYKEERKCRGDDYAEPTSGVVISLPPVVIIPADNAITPMRTDGRTRTKNY